MLTILGHQDIVRFGMIVAEGNVVSMHWDLIREESEDFKGVTRVYQRDVKEDMVFVCSFNEFWFGYADIRIGFIGRERQGKVSR